MPHPAIARPVRSAQFSPRFSNWLRSLFASSDYVVAGLVLFYVLLMSTLSILRHDSFHSGGYDLGVFDQVIWNSLHGRLYESSIMVDSPSVLGIHFSPILLALVPLYTIWSDARFLLIVQTVALAITAFPIYWVARPRVGRWAACLLAGCFLLFPALHGVNLYEFHEIALATPLLAFAAWFMLRERYGPFLVCLLLAMLTKEEVGLVVAGFGLYLLIAQRRQVLGVGLLLVGVTWTLSLITFVIPHFYGNNLGSGYFYQYRYGYLGTNLGQVLQTVLTQPGLVIAHLLIPAKLDFLLLLLVPLAGLPLFGGWMLILLLPSLAYSLTADYAPQYSIHYQYTAPLLPFIFFAAAIGLSRVLNWLGKVTRSNSRAGATAKSAVLVALAIAALLSFYFQSDAPPSQHFQAEQFAISSHVQTGYRLLAQIPADAGVIAEATLAPHLSHRSFIYQPSFVPDMRKIDYIIADQKAAPHFETSAKEIWDTVLGLPYFETIASEDGFILKKRSSEKMPVASQVSFANGMALAGYEFKTEQIVRGKSLGVVLQWQPNQAVRQRYLVFVHLLDRQGHLVSQDSSEPGRGWLHTDNWNAGETFKDGYVLPVPAVTPPGRYRISVSVCSVETQDCVEGREASQPVGTEATVGFVDIPAPLQQSGDAGPEVAHSVHASLGDLELVGYTPDLSEYTTGEHISLGLYWHAQDKPSGDRQVAVQLRNSAGTVAYEERAQPASGGYPTSHWQPGDWVLDWHVLDIPSDLAEGDYDIWVRLLDSTTGQVLGESEIGQMPIKSVAHNYTLPSISHPFEATFNHEIQLLGWNARTDNQKLDLTLFWKALGRIPESYTVFVHVLDGRNNIVAQQDHLPVQGSRPTNEWVPGEIITDDYELDLRSSKLDELRVEIGMYQAASGKRLVTAQGPDHLTLNPTAK